MPGGVQQSGTAPEPIRLDPNPPQPQPGVRSILGNRKVQSAPCCGPRNPVLRALRYLGGLLSRAFAALRPCGARTRDTVLTPERAAERTVKQLARTMDQLPPIQRTKEMHTIELRKLAEAHRRWIELDPENAEGKFDAMVERLVNAAPLWRGEAVQQLVNGLRGSQPIIDCRKDMQALGDNASAAILDRLELAVARAVTNRERTAVKSNVRAAIERIGKRESGDREREDGEIKQKILEAAQDARSRCVKLKQQGLIADVDAAMRDFIENAVDHDFDRAIEDLVNRGWDKRALKLLKELRESQPIIHGEKNTLALDDIEVMLGRLEGTLLRAMVKRELNTIKINFLGASIAWNRKIQPVEEIKRRFIEAAEDGLARCRELKKQGLIIDEYATLAACMTESLPQDLRDAVVQGLRARADQVQPAAEESGAEGSR